MSQPPVTPPPADRRPPPWRGLWIALGSLFVALGAAGAVLPLLPTTPFLLVAAACYARGSPRLHRWLLAHRMFGSTIRAWESSRALPRGVKLPAVLVVLLTFGLSFLYIDSPAVRVVHVSCGLALTVFLLRMPVIDVARLPVDEPAPAEEA